MAKVLAAKMGAGKSQYGLAVDTSAVIEQTTKTSDTIEKLIKACTEMKKDFGDSLAGHLEKAATTAGAYGKSMQNTEAGGIYANVQARFLAAAAARRAYAGAIDANQIKALQAFKETARKGVAVAKAKAKGKEDNPELAAAVEAANTEAANVEKSVAAALTAYNQKAGQLLIEISDKLSATETELNAACKASLAPA